jgi:hypothetical protein
LQKLVSKSMAHQCILKSFTIFSTWIPLLFPSLLSLLQSCNKHTYTDMLFLKIFVFFSLLEFPYPGLLQQLFRICPSLSSHGISRFSSSFCCIPMCIQYLCQLICSSTLVFYQEALPFHAHLPVAVVLFLEVFTVHHQQF